MSDSEIKCKRCGRDAAPPSQVPYGGQLGQDILAHTCDSCWQEWLQAEVMVINELKLNFMEPQSQDILAKQLREFLILPASEA
jgi:Fe-S cluster biosynthesis and repair protein YggX